jgi:hypothetical protein
MVRLEGNGGTWDIGDNFDSFAIRDSNLNIPFSIVPGGGPAKGIHMDAVGGVAIGTLLPESALHVYGDNTADTVIGIGPSPDGTPGDQSALNVVYGGELFGRGAGFFNIRPDSGAAAPNPSLRFLIADNQRMILDNEGFLGLGVGNPANPIEHVSGAVLTAGGQWQSVSSRTAKRDIRPLAPADALAALEGLEPVRFFYKAEPDDEYLGFIAEDVPDLVATGDHRRLGPQDVVAVLTKVVQQQQAAIREQRSALQRQQATIEELMARLGALEERQPPP